MPMIIHHLQAAHPEYYYSINTDFGESGVENIVKWRTLNPATSPNFTCHKCENRPFQSSASSLIRSHCIDCASRGFKVTIYQNPRCVSYSANPVNQTAQPTENHPPRGIDTVSEHVTLHTTLSGFPPGTYAPEAYVCFQCRVLLDNISDLEGHLRHSPSHETDVIAQLEMHGRNGLVDMLPTMFIVRGDYTADANDGDGNKETEHLIQDDEKDRYIKKRLVYVTDANTSDRNQEAENLIWDDERGSHIEKRLVSSLITTLCIAY